ncbi:hypothetical protein [uncultured Fibrella sp.]|uniref:hypothetical protein n=1 Tax=uncultured Fibrella sp. TaxID=1284596 RepID=UPI0035C9FBCD
MNVSLQNNNYILVLMGVLVCGICIGVTWFVFKRIVLRKERTNQELLQQIRDLISGGNGFSYVTLHPGEGEDASVILRNRSGYPIYGLHITIRWQPFDKLIESTKHQPEDNFQQNSVQFRPRPEIPNYFHGMTIGKIKRQVNGTYIIDFEARNGSWTQEYSIWKEMDHPEKHVWKVTKYVNGKKLVLREETIEIKPQEAYMDGIAK